MMTDVYLHGSLSEQFGHHHRFDIFNTAEAVRALEANHKGFYAAIRPGKFQIIRGDFDTGEQLCTEQLMMGLGGSVHIVPAVEGGKSGKGIITLVLGIVLVAFAAWVVVPAALAGFGGAAMGAEAVSLGGMCLSYGQVLTMGAALTLSGVSQMMAPTPQVNDYKTRDKKVSFLFNGAVNRTEQGGALSLIYGGPIRVGSNVVSGGVRVFDGKAKLPSALACTITATPKLWIKPCGAVQVLKGSGITFKIKKTVGLSTGIGTIVANTVQSHVDVDGVSQGKISTYTFTNVQADHTINVEHT